MSKSTLRGIVALFIAAVLAVGVCVLGYVSRNADGKWFKNGDLASWHWADTSINKPDDSGDHSDNPLSDNSVNSGNSVVTENKNNGVSVLCVAMPRALYAANGIASAVDSAYTLTVNVEPVGATDNFEWVVSNNDDEAITLTVFDDGLSATLACNKAFDVQKVVTVTSTSNTSLTASCTLDYYKRLESVSVKSPTSIKLSTTEKTYKVELEPHYGKGTILDTTVSIGGGKIECVNQIKTNTHAYWNGMEAKASESVSINGNGNFSLIMSPSAKSSFYKVKGADCTGIYNAYFKEFISHCGDYSEGDYILSVNWYATRNGGTFDNGTATVNGRFDVSDLVVPANSMSLSQNGILF